MKNEGKYLNIISYENCGRTYTRDAAEKQIKAHADKFSLENPYLQLFNKLDVREDESENEFLEIERNLFANFLCKPLFDIIFETKPQEKIRLNWADVQFEAMRLMQKLNISDARMMFYCDQLKEALFFLSDEDKEFIERARKQFATA